MLNKRAFLVSCLVCLVLLQGYLGQAQEDGGEPLAEPKSYQEHFNRVQKLQAEAIEKVLALGDWQKQKEALPGFVSLILNHLNEARSISATAASDDEPEEVRKEKQFKVFSLTIENSIFFAQLVRVFPRIREQLKPADVSSVEMAFAFCKAAKLDSAFIGVLDEALTIIKMSDAQFSSMMNGAAGRPGSSGAKAPASKTDRAKRAREASRARQRGH